MNCWFVQGCFNILLYIFKRLLIENYNAPPPEDIDLYMPLTLSFEDAIAIIQRAERARAGRDRVNFLKSERIQERLLGKLNANISSTLNITSAAPGTPGSSGTPSSGEHDGSGGLIML
jgi:hypothetical protein